MTDPTPPLAIVHDLVTAMGGTVTARASTEGSGASLVIELPSTAGRPNR